MFASLSLWLQWQVRLSCNMKQMLLLCKRRSGIKWDLNGIIVETIVSFLENGKKHLAFAHMLANIYDYPASVCVCLCRQTDTIHSIKHTYTIVVSSS